MRLNPWKTRSVVVNLSLTYASSYGDLTLGGEELEQVKSLSILGVTFDSKLTLETYFLKLC